MTRKDHPMLRLIGKSLKDFFILYERKRSLNRRGYTRHFEALGIATMLPEGDASFPTTSRTSLLNI
jgi:hypothetical protein